MKIAEYKFLRPSILALRSEFIDLEKAREESTPLLTGLHDESKTLFSGGCALVF
jgi:hypothetical protein